MNWTFLLIILISFPAIASENLLIEFEAKIKSKTGVHNLKKEIPLNFNGTVVIGRKDLDTKFQIKARRIGVPTENWRDEVAEFEIGVFEGNDSIGMEKKISGLGSPVVWITEKDGKDISIKLETKKREVKP